MKRSTRGHHQLVRYGRPSKWRICCHGKGEMCVAGSTKPFSDIGSTVVSYNYGKEAPTRKSIY
jgi:hypothetical protein